MCPVIEGADLTSVSTTREPYPEGEYTVTVKESEVSEDGRTLTLKSVIDEPAQYQGRELWDFINLVQNDGKQNKIGLTTIKRYLEAAFGKKSSEAEASPPDTDVLNGQTIKVYLKIGSYKKDGQDVPKNEVKKIYEA